MATILPFFNLQLFILSLKSRKVERVIFGQGLQGGFSKKRGSAKSTCLSTEPSFYPVKGYFFRKAQISTGTATPFSGVGFTAAGRLFQKTKSLLLLIADRISGLLDHALDPALDIAGHNDQGHSHKSNEGCINQYSLSFSFVYYI
jgi:hypothetical protein